MSRELHSWFNAVVQSVEGQLQRSCWTPAADVCQTPGGWLVKLDVAGVRPEDVKVEIGGRRLTVSGCRRDELATQGLTYHRMEISYNCFHRTLEFPEPLDNARLTMQMEQGMLMLRIERN